MYSAMWPSRYPPFKVMQVDEFRLVVTRAAQFMKFVSGLEKPLPEDRGVGV